MDLCDQVDELDKVSFLKMLGEDIARVPFTLKFFQDVDDGFILLFG